MYYYFYQFSFDRPTTLLFHGGCLCVGMVILGMILFDMQSAFVLIKHRLSTHTIYHSSGVTLK